MPDEASLNRLLSAIDQLDALIARMRAAGMPLTECADLLNAAADHLREGLYARSC